MLSLEVVPLPLIDVDGARDFYTEQVGFTLDLGYKPTAEFRVVQLTPLGSRVPCNWWLLTRAAGAQPLPRYDRPCGRAGETDRPRRCGRRGSPQGPSRDVDRREERRAGFPASRPCQFADFADRDSNSFRLPSSRLPPRRTGSARGLGAMRAQNRGDQSREATLELLAAADVAHLHPVPFASDQSRFPERPEML